MQATTNQGYALLIGVNDYSAYDRSQDQTKGTSDLPGSVNDVKAWWTLCNALGFLPENVRVLTAPGIHGEKLAGATEHTQGEATEQGIRDGVKWLAEKLGGAPAAIGLLTYSGHGDFVEKKGLVLCPTNVTGDDLEHAIPYADLRRIIDAARAGENLTVVLDCCHAGGGALPQRKGLSLTRRAVPAGILQGISEISGRVLSAAPRDGTAYQAEFAGRYHGAFTWALTSTLEQWKAVQQGDCLRLTVSYGEALRRAQGLLSTLSFPQTPGLHGVANVADLAVLQSGLTPQPTSPEPNVSPIPLQVDPGERDYRLYFINWNGSRIGTILVPRTTNTSFHFEAGVEYWYMTGNIASGSRSTNLTFSWADYDWPSTAPNPGTLSFKMPQSTAWSGSDAPTNEAMTFVRNGQFAVSLLWSLTETGGVWSGSLSWYSTTGQNTVFGGTGATTSVTLASYTTPAVSWFCTRVAPQ